jgi:hypothetical protein
MGNAKMKLYDNGENWTEENVLSLHPYNGDFLCSR